MRLYSVHLRAHGRDPERDLVLVKEGFSWPAFVFTAFWAVATRMWLPAMVLFTVVVLSGWAVHWFRPGETVEGLLSTAVALGIGLVGNDVRRWWLGRQGFQEVAMVSGKNDEEAMRRFLDDAEIVPGAIYPGAAS